MISLSAVAILSERLDHRLRISVYDGQQNAGRPVGNPAPLLPLLKRAGIETEAVGDFDVASQPRQFARTCGVLSLPPVTARDA